MGKVVKVQHNQSDYVKQELEKLMDTGKTDKKELYSIIETKTGLPRPTIRRVAGDLRKDLSRKINILEMTVQKKSDKINLIPVKCSTCGNKICYLEGKCDGNLVCNICKDKFPEAKKHK